ncbi:helix-turn-helix domain-containing protein [Lysinibacillus xylanilyticus]|uniref:helix-turn-helix domain-containing protein n=1 Tax=Lysinibacillus xylanilyticus TaxID=582475 RepID=UPI003D00E14C
MPIQFTLAKTLHSYDIQQIELAEESNTRPTTISQMCRNDIKRVNIEMVDRLIPALERLTGAKHSLEDVMIYVRDDETDAN